MQQTATMLIPETPGQTLVQQNEYKLLIRLLGDRPADFMEIRRQLYEMDSDTRASVTACQLRTLMGAGILVKNQRNQFGLVEHHVGLHTPPAKHPGERANSVSAQCCREPEVPRAITEMQACS